MTMILEIFWAVVAASTGFLRNAPDYEAPLETQLMMGSVVRVDSTKSYWCHVHSMEPGYDGWINDLQLSIKTESELEDYIAAPKFVCTAEYSHVYAEPSESAGRLCGTVLGELVRRHGGCEGDWLEVMLPDNRTGWMPRSDVAPFEQWAASREASEKNLVETAMQFVGATYMWGGNSVKYFDCSGLTRTVYYLNGLLLPRNASQQVKLGEQLPLDMDEWRPGDLLFFGTPATSTRPMRIGHVAMYIGGGKIIHASKVVRVNSLVKGTPDFYDRRVLAARRMITRAGESGGPGRLVDCSWYFKQ